MLRSTGIDSTLLMAHRRNEGQLVKDPCLSPMNTPLVMVDVGEGKPVFCCPATQVVPFGYVPAGVQGSEALPVTGTGKGLMEVPILPASAEQVVTHSEIELQADGRMRVKRTVQPGGSAETDWREWSKLRPEEIAQKFEGIVSSIHPNARLLSYSAGNVDNLDENVTIEYEYEVEGYALTAGGELLTFKLPELYYSASSIEKYERELPMFWGRRYSLDNTVTIKLPEGFRVRSLPAQVKSYEGKKPFMYYEASFVEKGGTVVFRDIFERNSVYEPARAYPIFIRAVKESAQLAKEWVVIEKSQ
jgi:hypothetical protein